VPLPNFNGNRTRPADFDGAINPILGRFRSEHGQKDSLSFYAFAQNGATVNTLPFTGSTLPGMGDQSLSFTKQFVTSWNHTFSSNVLNELRAGYTRLNFSPRPHRRPYNRKMSGFLISFAQYTAGAGYPFMGSPDSSTWASAPRPAGRARTRPTSSPKN